ncbi:glycerol-3-phosphate dehydrogenase/oxidase [Niabella yanshanensis]|uniref:Glycerol-3-phosphate dehydrogenase/oxidase n=1 Tax=Niabella yanshanensis TaxID=577386 RepID=A0ABZ0W1W5_9BACT|nr:glycerol-3-phosphate dehydrogenase/oxidase [Niabella yanshanensis]WQD36909.1 glycerol-3-phosphate dehydrogenase/oxidase [Niabella yanshanensis]
MQHIFNRDYVLQQLGSREIWDVVVIGGGATGLGVALDAVSRGYTTLLVEQADFAKGTSSRSTKLVHGGVRYLAQGDVKLVREACIERGLLQKNAPHLVKNQTFIIPVYNVWDRIKYTLGLKVYDWIAGKLSLGKSVFVPRSETLKQLPGIKEKGLLGGVLYHDGQFDDSRLALNLAQSIAENGGLVLNYAEVTGLLKNKDGKLNGATIVDTEKSRSYQVKAKAIVNATGVFVDDILKMDDAEAGQTVVASQGIHLVVDKKFYPSAHALMIPETSDGRVLFAVPWHNEVVLGTTDTPVGQPSIEPRALEKEINFILQTASAYLDQPPTRKDVLSVFAGLRPLAAPQSGSQKTKEISRSHKIITSSSDLFTIIGGKWTTFRKMGEDMIDTIENQLQWPSQKTTTETKRIHGFSETVNWNDPFYFYGADAVALKKNINGAHNTWLSESLKIHAEQVRWAVQHEMARTVEDFLARRTRALLLDAKESIRICTNVAHIMAIELGRDNDWIQAQIEGYTKLATQYQLA